ncbi:MAG TPA: hypothetical protein VME92_22185, partial [Acetobacteraceae bacterium]|nr:hypothetical protein [Acetobacteraceae bacterium]
MQGLVGRIESPEVRGDQRILTRAGRIDEVLPPSLTVVTLADFFRDLRFVCRQQPEHRTER